jgi:hypothetical protein
LKLWNTRLEKELRLQTKALEKVAKASAGFSYAYLKELVLSSMMAWMRQPCQRKMDEVMAGLAQQINQSTEHE